MSHLDRVPSLFLQSIIAGHRDALDELVTRIQQPISALAVRMLWHPEDARDATQEILVRIVTHLGSFRGESRFMTWAYRVAANHLRTCRRSRVEEQRYTFERFGDELQRDLAEGPARDEWPADRATLLEEVKVGCMLGMLTCLDRDSRLAYVLGEILELEGPEAAEILEITPAAFRQRLTRTRSALVAFTRGRVRARAAGQPVPLQPPAAGRDSARPRAARRAAVRRPRPGGRVSRGPEQSPGARRGAPDGGALSHALGPKTGADLLVRLRALLADGQKPSA